MHLSLFLILTNAIHKKQRNAFAYLRNLRNVLSWIHLLQRQSTILSHKKDKSYKKFQCNAIFSETKQRGKGKKEGTMCTSRSLRVSDSMQPLLGRPRRTLVRSGTRASSTGPFTSATWDCCDEAQHTKTVRLKGNEGIEPERHGWSIDIDIAFSVC